jgi:hypothetical protein
MLASLLLFTACAQVGPRALTAGRPLYNIAVQETESQQLLLNIVRQRYNDPVMFIDVTSITSSFNVSASAGLFGDLVTSGSHSATGTLGASISEAPIISYSPNVGESFVRQMLTPLDLSTVGLVLQAGWSIERLFLVIGQSIDSYRTFSSGEDPEAQFRRLQEVLSALRSMQRSNIMTVGVEPGAEGELDGLILMFAPEAKDLPAYATVCEFVEVPCDGRALYLKQAVGEVDDDKTLTLSTRSLYSTLFFLSRGVEVPVEHRQRGIASDLSRIPGGPFDWNNPEGALFHVRSSADEPKDASVRVFYRGSWFYIADTDRDSKVTFALLSTLMTLQSGEAAKVTPLITLPAG